jgi:hypothetical protein
MSNEPRKLLYSPGTPDAAPPDHIIVHDCTTVGCVDAVVVNDLVVASAEVIRTMNLRVCRNREGQRSGGTEE